MKTGINRDNGTGLRGSLLISALIHLGIIALLIYMSGAISAGMMIAGAPALEIIPVQFEPAPEPAPEAAEPTPEPAPEPVEPMTEPAGGGAPAPEPAGETPDSGAGDAAPADG